MEIVEKQMSFQSSHSTLNRKLKLMRHEFDLFIDEIISTNAFEVVSVHFI